MQFPEFYLHIEPCGLKQEDLIAVPFDLSGSVDPGVMNEFLSTLKSMRVKTNEPKLLVVFTDGRTMKGRLGYRRSRKARSMTVRRK